MGVVHEIRTRSLVPDNVHKAMVAATEAQKEHLVVHVSPTYLEWNQCEKIWIEAPN